MRNYTQNIDTLERVAGVPPELLVRKETTKVCATNTLSIRKIIQVEAHGSFGGAKCIDCSRASSMDLVKE